MDRAEIDRIVEEERPKVEALRKRLDALNAENAWELDREGRDAYHDEIAAIIRDVDGLKMMTQDAGTIKNEAMFMNGHVEELVPWEL